MGQKNMAIFKSHWLRSISILFSCLNKVQKEIFDFSYFWRFADIKTARSRLDPLVEADMDAEH